MKIVKRSHQPPYWFRAKSFGWGWTPATWQGWATLAVYMFAVVTMFLSVDERSHSISDTFMTILAPCIVATLIFMAICYRTGEKLEWRWIQQEKKNKRNTKGKKYAKY